MAFETTLVTAIHMRPARTGVVEYHGNQAQLLYLSTIALVLLAMAGFNYVLLSLARAFQRVCEVDIRKAIGGSRIQLFRQYMSESAVLTVVAVLTAYTLAELVLPLFPTFMQSDLVSAVQSLKTRKNKLLVAISRSGCRPP